MVNALLLQLIAPLSLAMLQRQPPEYFQKTTLNTSSKANQTAWHQAGRVLFSHLGRQESKERAARFESPKCQELKAAADLRRWGRSALHMCFNLHRAQSAHICPEKKVMYVTNQKAGCSYMNAHMPELFGVQSVDTKSGQLKFYDGGEEFADPKPLDVGQDFVAFTVVREPITTAVDAYLEVSYRMRVRLEIEMKDQATGVTFPKPDFVDMPCDTREQATRRLKTYLSTARAGKTLGIEFFHSFPQALKVDINLTATRDHTYDSIVLLENMLDDLKGVPNFVGELPERDHDHSHAADPCADVDMEDPDLMGMLCEMYHVDYECFGYALPAACRRSRA